MFWKRYNESKVKSLQNKSKLIDYVFLKAQRMNPTKKNGVIFTWNDGGEINGFNNKTFSDASVKLAYEYIWVNMFATSSM